RARRGRRRGGAVGAVDGRLAEHARAVVDDDGLAGRDAAQGRARERDLHALRRSLRGALDGAHARGDRGAVGTDLHLGVDPLPRRGSRTVEPHGGTGLDAVDAEELGRADDDAVARGLHVEDVPGPAVGRRAVDPQTLALADGERVRAVVLAEDGALRVDDLARARAQALAQEALGVAVGDEADVVGVGLRGDRQAATRRPGPPRVLRREATAGEDRARQALGAHDREHVGLVLRGVGRAVQLADGPRAAGRGRVRDVARDDARVVARRDGVEPERGRLVEQRLELDVLVAAHAR